MRVYPVSLETNTKECYLLLKMVNSYYDNLQRKPTNSRTEATYWEIEACENLATVLAKLGEYTPPNSVT